VAGQVEDGGGRRDRGSGLPTSVDVRDALAFLVGDEEVAELLNRRASSPCLIVIGLAAISNDAALRKLKAKRWKRLQR